MVGHDHDAQCELAESHVGCGERQVEALVLGEIISSRSSEPGRPVLMNSLVEGMFSQVMSQVIFQMRLDRQGVAHDASPLRKSSLDTGRSSKTVPPAADRDGGLFADPRLPDALARLGAPGGYEAFEAQVQGARFCRRPVRLIGSVTRLEDDGSRSTLFRSASQPDGVLLKACGTRRQSLCPPCASIYRGDAFALVAAGLRGSKGVPETVAGHPAVLLTLTAPSFGPVHRRTADGSCHPYGRSCPHGTALVCGARHSDGDRPVGEALCPRCYDYEAAVLFNAGVSELWRRTTIYALRALGNLAGMSVRCVAKQVRLSYVKVVEFQRRGSVHLHALVRLDSAGDGLAPPPEHFSADLLASALELAARRVSAPCAGREGPDEGRVRWGRELDVAVITDHEQGRRRAAAYLAKYSTKSTEELGVLDHRLRAGVPESLDLSAHMRRLVETAWSLGADPSHQKLGLRLWAHTAGYRGHFLTKSRRFSTTFAALRDARREWRIAANGHQAPDTSPGTDDGAEIISEWTFVGMGYTTPGDAWLAESIAEEERLARRCAYEERQERVAGGVVTSGALAEQNPWPTVDLITIPEAARRVGLHVDTLYRLCRTGRFPPAIQIGARWRVSVPRLERYLHDDAQVDQQRGKADRCL